MKKKTDDGQKSELRVYADDLWDYQEPMKGRDSLFGGHVNCYKLMCEAGLAFDIDYIGKRVRLRARARNVTYIKISYRCTLGRTVSDRTLSPNRPKFAKILHCTN